MKPLTRRKLQYLPRALCGPSGPSQACMVARYGLWLHVWCMVSIHEELHNSLEGGVDGVIVCLVSREHGYQRVRVNHLLIDCPLKCDLRHSRPTASASCHVSTASHASGLYHCMGGVLTLLLSAPSPISRVPTSKGKTSRMCGFDVSSVVISCA